LRKTSLDKLLEIRKSLIEAEFKMKTGQSGLSDIVLELAMLS
jgi:hypothetical protein